MLAFATPIPAPSAKYETMPLVEAVFGMPKAMNGAKKTNIQNTMRPKATSVGFGAFENSVNLFPPNSAKERTHLHFIAMLAADSGSSSPKQR